MEKLKRQLADADAALEARKKPAEDAGPKIIGEGLVIDEWVSYLYMAFEYEFSLAIHYFWDMLDLYIIPDCVFRRRGGKDTLQSNRAKWL